MRILEKVRMALRNKAINEVDENSFLIKGLFVTSSEENNYSFSKVIVVSEGDSVEIILDKIAWLVNIDDDFDENLYFQKKPETEMYYQPWAEQNNISERRRLYHHYFLYDEEQREDIEKLEIDEDFDVDDYLRKQPDANDYCCFWTKLCQSKRIFCHYLKIGKKSGYKIIKKKSVYVRVKNGLANRLRTLNSFYALSKKCNKKLFVCWSSGEGWSDDQFTDLFDPIEDVNFISVDEFEAKSAKCFKLHEAIKKTEDANSYLCCQKPENVKWKIMNSNLCYHGDSCLEYMMPSFFADENAIYPLLKPTANLQEKIEKVRQKFSDRTIGVHARRGDAWKSPWKSNFKASDDEAFFEKIDEEIEKDQEISIFLSTDSKETNSKFIEKYGSRIIYHEEKKFFDSKSVNDPKPNQDDAVIDLFLLSSTSKIIGTNWSSYSGLSAKIGNIPIRFAVKKVDVSVCCAVMNREKALKISLSSWLQFEEIKEIVIVDWSSDRSLIYLEKLDPRIRVIRIEITNPYYNSSKALNIAIKNAKENYILKLDADYVLNPYFSFFEQNALIKKGIFVAGNWADKRLDNELGFIEMLNGLLFAAKKDIEDAGFYNENMEGYGYEDCDLYWRMEMIGVKRKQINHNNISAFHIPHSDFYRSANYKCKDIVKSLQENLEKSR